MWWRYQKKSSITSGRKEGKLLSMAKWPLSEYWLQPHRGMLYWEFYVPMPII
jgi:hypothetical protein